MELNLQSIPNIIVEQFNISWMQKLFFSLGVVIAGYLLALWTIKLINSQIEDYKRRHQSRRYTYYVITAVVIITIIFIWLDKSISWSTFFGFLSAGLALALHQVLLNIAGWVLIILHRPFSLGDRVEIDGVQGDVIDIQVFYTTLLEVGNWVKADQSTGRVVNIPNGTVFKNALFNYTMGFEYLWNEISVLITFQSNWELAEQIILKIAEEEREEIEGRARQELSKMSKRYMIKYGKFTPITYVEIKESGVEIILRYLTSVRKRRDIETKINQLILTKFKANPDIEIAYPTRTVYRHNYEAEKD